MSLWIRLSTDILTDPKLLEAGIPATVMWVRGLLLSKQHMTDGFVHRWALPILGMDMTPEQLAASPSKLVEVGLWEVVENGWRVPPHQVGQVADDPCRSRGPAAQTRRRRPQGSGEALGLREWQEWRTDARCHAFAIDAKWPETEP